MTLNMEELQDRLRDAGNGVGWRKWGAIIGGSALAVYGLSRRSKAGTILAAAGGAIAYGGTRDYSPARDLHAEASFTVNVPQEEAYRFWLNLENLPKFMTHLESVKDLGNRKSEWVARGPLEIPVRWTAEIIDQSENSWLVWRSDPDAVIPNTGSVQFRPATGNRGTVVTVVMQYQPPAGALGRAFAKLFGKDPSQTIYEDLRHFKQLIETGEIATTVGQPHGSRSAFVRAKHGLMPDYRPRQREGVAYEPERIHPNEQPQEVAS